MAETADSIIIRLLEDLSRTRALSDAESILLERTIRRDNKERDMVDRPFRRWTPADERKALKMAEQRKTAKEIAAKLKRSPWSVYRRLCRLRGKDKWASRDKTRYGAEHG